MEYHSNKKLKIELGEEWLNFQSLKINLILQYDIHFKNIKDYDYYEENIFVLRITGT